MNNVSNVEKTRQSSSFFEPETLDKVQLGALKVAKVAVVALAAIAMFAAVAGIFVGVSLFLPPLSPLLLGAIMIGGSAVAGIPMGAITGGVLAAIDKKAQQILSGPKTHTDMDKSDNRDGVRSWVATEKPGVIGEWEKLAQERSQKLNEVEKRILILADDVESYEELKELDLRLINLKGQLERTTWFDQSLLKSVDQLFAEVERLWKESPKGNKQ